MPKEMKRRDLEKALRSHGCLLKSGGRRGPHDRWVCPCGSHIANIPRHLIISPGVVRSTMERMARLPEGWLQ
jgi:hypothetical protein